MALPQNPRTRFQIPRSIRNVGFSQLVLGVWFLVLPSRVVVIIPERLRKRGTRRVPISRSLPNIDCKSPRLEYKCAFQHGDCRAGPDAIATMRFPLLPGTPASGGKSPFPPLIGTRLQSQGAFGQGGLDLVELGDKAGELRSR